MNFDLANWFTQLSHFPEIAWLVLLCMFLVIVGVVLGLFPLLKLVHLIAEKKLSHEIAAASGVTRCFAWYGSKIAEKLAQSQPRKALRIMDDVIGALTDETKPARTPLEAAQLTIRCLCLRAFVQQEIGEAEHTIADIGWATDVEKVYRTRLEWDSRGLRQAIQWLHALSDILAASNKWQLLIDTGTIIAEHCPRGSDTWTDAILKRAWGRRALGDYSGSTADADLVVKEACTANRQLYAHHERAIGHLYNGGYQPAVQDFTYVIDHAENVPGTLFEQRGIALYRIGDHLEDADCDFSRALHMGPLTPYGYVVYGDALRGLKKWHDAFQMYESARSAAGYFGCALVRIEEANQSPSSSAAERSHLFEAETFLARAIGLAQPEGAERADFHWTMADVKSRLGKHTEAEACHKRARELELQGRFLVEPARLLAIRWGILKATLASPTIPSDISKSVKEFQCLVDTDPSNATALFASGALLLKSEDCEGAISCFNAAIAADPNYAHAFLWRGFAWAKLHNWSLALEDAKRILEDAERILSKPPPFTNAHDLLAEAHRLKGISHYHLGDIPNSITELKSATTTSPDLAVAHWNLAEVFALKGRWREVVETTSAALLQTIRLPEIYLLRADAQWRLGRADQAVADCDEALRLRPGDQSAYRVRGFAKLVLNDLIQARLDLDNALLLKPDDADALIGLAQVSQKAGNLDEALRFLDQAVETSPRYAEAYWRRGWLRITRWERSRDETELDAAQTDFKALGSTAPDHPASLNGLAEIQLLRKDPNGAIAYLAQAEIRDASFWQIYELRGWVHFDRADWRTALGEFTKAIQKGQPVDCGSAHYGRGECLRLLGDPRTALTEYTAAIEILGDHWSSLVGRARASETLWEWQDALKDYSRALTCVGVGRLDQAMILRGRASVCFQLHLDDQWPGNLKMAVELDPGSAANWIDCGVLFYNAGRLPEAIEKFSLALEIEPKSAIALNNRGVARAYLGQSREAIDDLSRAIELDSLNDSYLQSRGWAWLRLREWTRALADLDRCLGLNESHKFALNNRALVHWNLGHAEMAKRDLEKLLALTPEPSTQAGLSRLREDEVTWGAVCNDWSRTIEGQPPAALPLYGRGITAWLAGRLDQAAADLRQASVIDPSLTRVTSALDRVLAELVPRANAA